MLQNLKNDDISYNTEYNVEYEWGSGRRDTFSGILENVGDDSFWFRVEEAICKIKQSQVILMIPMPIRKAKQPIQTSTQTTTVDYKVGDRFEVVCDFDGEALKGKLGTVIDTKGKNIGVKFDEKVGGYSCGGQCADGYGRYVFASYIKPLLPHTRLFKACEIAFIDINNPYINYSTFNRGDDMLICWKEESGTIHFRTESYKTFDLNVMSKNYIILKDLKF